MMPGQHAEDAALGAARHGPRRGRLREQAPVARRLLPGHEDRGLALELVDGAVDERLAEDLRGVVHEVAHREVVGAVDHDVVRLDDLERVLEVRIVSCAIDLDRRVDRAHPVERATPTFGRPMSAVEWMIWRCRFDTSTRSKSTTPIVPTPAAARYIAIGEPSPPAPIDQHLGVEQLALPVAADARAG